MRLKQITLQGYKTFATKTVFSFEDGVTAIVGPNGSGKSNIADALRWVLGEQSYRTLRGRRSTDMIFAGSQNRSRAGMAQAILTLDNSDNWLPIDFTEVEIGRRAYRSGESDYLLNGQRVRLRDLQELLATSGLAERTYTIIGQGLIDQALSLRSEERRALFEEAAGISHYKARRAETIRRLEETQRNLERIQDILAEIDPRLKSLRLQARRAQDYAQVAGDLRDLLRTWYGYNWEKGRERLKEQRRLTTEAEASWQGSRERLIAAQTLIGDLRRQAAGLQEEINDRQAERGRLQEQLSQVQRKVAISSERRRLLEQQLATITQELPHLVEQRAEAERELSAAAHELADAQENLSRQEAALSRFNMSFAAQQEEIDQAVAEVDRLVQQVGTAQKETAQAEGKIGQLRERLLESRLALSHKQELAELAEQVDSLKKAVQEGQLHVDDLVRRRGILQSQESATTQELKRLRAENNALHQEIANAGNELARLEARCEMLDSLRQEATPSLKEIPLVGRLAGLISIPPAYQLAVAAALGARLGTLILPDEESLWELIQANHGEKAFMAIARRNGAPQKTAVADSLPAGAFGWALNVVTCADHIQSLAPFLLGDVLLADGRESAYRLAKELPVGALVVAPDGFMVRSGGLVDFQPQDPQRNILAREEAWQEANKRRVAQQEQLEALQPGLKKLQLEIQSLQHTLDEQKEEERRLNLLLGQAATQLQKPQRKLDRANQQISFLKEQAEGFEAERVRLEARISETAEMLSRKNGELDQLNNQLKYAERRLAALPVAEAAQQRQDRQQQIETARTILAGRRAVVESRRTTLQQIERQLSRQEERYKELQEQFAGADAAEELRRAHSLETALREAGAALAPLTQRMQQNGRQLAEAESSLTSLQKTAHDLETHYAQCKIALSQQESQLEGLAERIRADLGLISLEFDDEHMGQTPLPIAEIVDELPDVKQLPDDIEENVRRLRGQLQRMGAINTDAPLEYEATKERSEFLTKQVADLVRTEKQLRDVIDELDTLTSDAFAKTVEVVNEVFSTMFARLFGGGSARLVLTEPDDPTISGVDIFARLPQRRQQSLALLSGGERALTAAALIFSLLKVNPPPFCVMDETDAMLDEVNITRFREVLCELAQEIQVIVITHNRGTVQAAQTVYGISMSGDSTSQVISIRPEDYLSQK